MSFEEAKKRMIPLSNFLYKKVIKEGNIELPKNARVTIDYNAYFENEIQTYDSTYMRGKPLSFILGGGEILEGVEQAVKTMKKGEESQFLISYNILYGASGCPPRIKPKADSLFVIRLKDFKEVVGSNDLIIEDGVEATPFTGVHKKVLVLDQNGKDAFRKGNLPSAISQYKKAVQELEYCRLKDETEEKVQQGLLQKLYLNLAVSYNRLDKPKSACTMINQLREMCKIDRNPKALYQEGKALRMLGEYDRARICLSRACKLIPDDENIIKEISICDDRAKQFKEEERRLCANALGVVLPAAKPKSDEKYNENKPEHKEFEKRIKDFMNCEAKSLHIQGPISDEVVNCIKHLESTFAFKLVINETSNGKDYKLQKLN